MFSSVDLSCLGLCLDEKSTYMHIGGLLVVLGAVVWKMVPSCLFWCLLREMNERSFEDREMTLEEI